MLENHLDEFHDSELDVFDLYNVLNGVLKNGVLDVGKLDELSDEELEIFDVAKLREIWAHTATGCSQCEQIISKLNLVRGILGACAETFVDNNVINAANALTS